MKVAQHTYDIAPLDVSMAYMEMRNKCETNEKHLEKLQETIFLKR